MSDKDNKSRVLLLETTTEESILREVFSSNGFKNTSLEVFKEHQNGSGMLKRLSNDWDMHIRFLYLHEGLIAIDAEVETSREFIEHVTKDNWISVIYETWEILKQASDKVYLFHRTTGLYVKSIISDVSIVLTKFNNQIEWKPIVIGAAIGITLGLILKELLKDK